MAKNTVRVLLIDNDAEYVSMVKHYLRSFQNYEFELTAEKDQARISDHLSSNPPFDVVLMDFNLPGNNGLELVRKIHEMNESVPLILLTNGKDFRVAIDAMKYGAEEYLVKDEATDTVLPRTIVGVLDRFKLKNQIQVAEKSKMLSEKSAEAIQELIVTMCHEFNNPLAAIRLSTYTLGRQMQDEGSKSLLQKLNDDITKLEKQIIKLRDLGGEKAPQGS